MNQPSSNEIERLLKDLQSRDAFVRQTATTEIGKLQLKHERIISALQTTASSDSNKYVRQEAERALRELTGSGPRSDQWKCPQCGKEQQYPSFTNHCLQCNASVISSRLSSIVGYPKVSNWPDITCFTVSAPTLVLAQPDSLAETLYVVGPGDVLPIVGEESEFYRLLLAESETGYVHKASGKQLQIGIGEVEQPIGYARLIDPNYPANVTFMQPDNTTETIYTLKKDDRLPIVEEREHTFKVQLPNGLRGWVDKGRVIRTVATTSLPPQESSGIASAVGLAATLGLAIVGGILSKVAEED